MDNGHHSILQGPSFPGEITHWHGLGSFFWCLWCDEGSPPRLFVSLFPLFIVVSFFLNGVPKVGTCPINLSLQLLGVVVRTEKYGFIKHKALNAIVTAFPLDVSVFSIIFSALVLFLLCETIWSVATGGLLPLLP